MTIGRFIGIDLAWAQRTDGRSDNETGLVALDGDGNVIEAGWCEGVPSTVEWLQSVADPAGTMLFVDAPLVVDNEAGQRVCERQVGQRYGRWKVSANSTNRRSPRLAGLALLATLGPMGWPYDSGLAGPPAGGLSVSECYPYTTLVGVEELGYDVRPQYKRKTPRQPVALWRPQRAVNCDELIRRIADLESAAPALHLRSHPETARLIDEPSPLKDRDYKHREDLLDATVAAWTALLWVTHGFDRCQVLGPDASGSALTIIAAARPEQRGSKTGEILRRNQ